MRTLNKNKQNMWYSLEGSAKDAVPVYDYYVDSEGKEIPIETGETKVPYLKPVLFAGNIAMSGGNAEAAEFGLSLADYEAILVMDKDSLPITETSVIWHNTEPQCNKDGTVDEKSADYSVVKISPSLNLVRYVLKKVVK